MIDLVGPFQNRAVGVRCRVPLLRRERGAAEVRWAAKGRGKRGGARVIYYWVVPQDRILMLFAYPKNEREDLTRDQIAQLRAIIGEEYP